MSPEKKKRLYLRISSQTSTEQIQKIFDYDHRDKLVNDSCDITAKNKFVALYRKQLTSELKVLELERLKVQQMKGFLFLFCIEIIIVNKKVKVKFYPVEKLKKMIKFQEQYQSSKTYRELFFVVRSFKDKNNFNTGYRLAVGQTIKLGVSQFKVNSLKISPDGIIYEIPASYSFYDNYRVYHCDRYPDNNQFSCKYCYESTQTQDNFLMNPCKCSGSAKAVHFQCLKPWVESRVKKEKIGQVIQYNFDRFQCEICKTELPRFIILQGKTYDLLFINKEQEGNFLILQQINNETNRILTISNINKNGYLIGRSQQCTILLTDNTVSRYHAQIKQQGDQFRIFDTKSKFGTLIKQEEMSFELDFAPKMVQVGKTTIQFSLVKKDL